MSTPLFFSRGLKLQIRNKIFQQAKVNNIYVFYEGVTRNGSIY